MASVTTAYLDEFAQHDSDVSSMPAPATDRPTSAQTSRCVMVKLWCSLTRSRSNNAGWRDVNDDDNCDVGVTDN